MYVKDDEINQYFNNHNWSVATSHFKNSTIDKMSVILDYHLYKINAHINLHHKTEECNIEIDKSGSITSFNCTCNDCKDNELACSHIGITLFKFYGLANDDIPYLHNQEIKTDKLVDFYKEKEQARKTKQQYNIARKLIEQYQKDSFVNLYPSFSNKIFLSAGVKKDFDKLLVSYRVGNNVTYMIKNLGNFIDNVLTASFFSYGKQLEFNHDIDAFDDFSIKQINFIKNNIPSNTKNLTIRTIEISNKNIDDFFEIYHDANKYINLNFYQEDLSNIGIIVKKEKDSFKFFLDKMSGLLLFGKSRIYFYDNTSIYQYSSTMSKSCKLFLKQLLDNDIIHVSNEEMHYFCKYILCKIIPYIKFTGDSFDDYYPYEVTLQMYLDLEDNGSLSISTLLKKNNKTLNIAHHSIEKLMMKLPVDINQAFEMIERYFDYDYVKQLGYMEDKNDDIYDFVKNILPLLNNTGEVFISEEIKKIDNPVLSKVQIGVQIKNNLLEIDLTNIDIKKEDIIEILNSYQRNKKYHRLKTGQVINLDNPSIKEISQLLNTLQVKDSNLTNEYITVDSSKALYLNEYIKDSEFISINRSDSFIDLIQNTTDVPNKKFIIPKHYESILRDYQLVGFRWLKTMSEYGFGGILADDMGLGKTLQIITLLEDQKNLNMPNLVVCPTTLILNWEDEIKKFSQNLKYLCINAPLEKRLNQIKEINNYDVIVTSYDYLRRDYELYHEINFNYIILDEAQYIKNQSTKNALAVKQLNALHRFALTGTPIENSLAELWSIFDFLMPNYLFNYKYFRDNYEYPIVRNNDHEVKTNLQKMVEPFILRRTKKEVLTELPDKIETDVHIEFSSEEEKLYLANLSNINEELQAKLGITSPNNFQVLAMMTRLRQICCDPRILYPDINNISSKMASCLNIIESAHESNKKVLLFSSFTSTLGLLEKELIKRNISYYVLDGSTTKSKRHRLVSTFQKDKTTVFLISLKAGGTGLNLTAAEIVIHFDPWWNLSAQNQATDRAYRIGQTNTVNVYKLIMKNSIEEKIQDLQQMKIGLSDTFIEHNKGSITNMSTTQILDLFKIE